MSIDGIKLHKFQRRRRRLRECGILVGRQSTLVVLINWILKVFLRHFYRRVLVYTFTEETEKHVDRLYIYIYYIHTH